MKPVEAWIDWFQIFFLRRHWSPVSCCNIRYLWEPRVVQNHKCWSWNDGLPRHLQKCLLPLDGLDFSQISFVCLLDCRKSENIKIRQLPDRSGSCLIKIRPRPDRSGCCLIKIRQMPNQSGRCLIEIRQWPDQSGSHHGKIRQLPDWSISCQIEIWQLPDRSGPWFTRSLGWLRPWRWIHYLGRG